MKNRVGEALKRYFISGALVITPLILTFLLLRLLFETVDGILSPYIEKLFGYSIPGLGLLTTLLLILLAGVLTRNFVGSQLFHYSERLIARFPLVRTIYGGAKQLVEGFTLPQKKVFKQVALVEYPRRGAYAISFVISRPALNVDGVTEDRICLFVPSTPTPVSGAVILVPKEDVIFLEMPVEDGIKFLVSGGIVSPEMFVGSRNAPPPSADIEAGVNPTV